MTVIRMKNGDLWVCAPVALDTKTKAAVDAQDVADLLSAEVETFQSVEHNDKQEIIRKLQVSLRNSL